MRFEKVRAHLSAPRIGRFLHATKNRKAEAVALYRANLKVSRAFLPLIATLEVIMRNRLNEVLTTYFNDYNWIINQKGGFMIDPRLTYIDKRSRKPTINRYLKGEVEKAERRILKSGARITSGKLISEQNLGFWTDFYEVHHYKILLGRPIQIFKKLPPDHGRKEVAEILTRIRLFRNRIYHNEPICFLGTDISLENAMQVYHSIKNILSWIDEDIIKWLIGLDEVVNQINRAKKIALAIPYH